MNSDNFTSIDQIKKEEKPARRYDIDWLRVLAVLLLLPIHTGRIFDTFGPWYIKNSQLSKYFTYFNELFFPWHMPLLFLLAGASTWFALGFRSGGKYFKERFKRLLVPFIFGLLVIVPPQSYFGLLSHTGFSESFLQWYPKFFSINPGDLDGYFLGGFSLGHMWFVLYLFIFSLVLLPFFLIFKRVYLKSVREWLVRFLTLPGMILLLAIPLYISVRLLDFYPSPILFLTYFLYGYILFADSRFEKTIDRHKQIALILGPVLFLIVPYFKINGWPVLPGWQVQILIFYVDALAPWLFIIAILGYGRQFLNFTSRFLRYNAEASYPVYILHQTVIVIIGYFVVQWTFDIAIKYVTILISATVVTVILYDVLVKRTKITRFLFGMRPLMKTSSKSRATELDKTKI